MKLTGGIAKGLNIYSPKSPLIRPALSSVRSSLFNILTGQVENKNFLDLFAGSGVIGLEALSRGANFCLFVDSNIKCVNAIVENLKRLGFLHKAKVIKKNAFAISTFLLYNNFCFDMVFMGPPYKFFINEDTKKRLLQLMECIIKSGVITECGVFIIEHRTGYGFEKIPYGVELYDTRKYGQTTLSFYRKN